MLSQKNKFNINPSKSKPQYILFLSMVIDASYNISKLSMSVTCEKIDPQKNTLQDISKVHKIYIGGTYSDHMEYDSNPK